MLFCKCAYVGLQQGDTVFAHQAPHMQWLFCEEGEDAGVHNECM
jgi:hypothetical protein